GLELTVRAHPSANVDIDFNAARVDAQFDEFYTDGVSLAGNAPANVPKTTANLWANWSVTPQVELGAGIRHVDERYGNVTNTQTLPAYTTYDAYANWALTENLTLIVRGRNLTDEDYVLSQYVTDQ